ncbi:MAG: histidine--tRNA ligase [Microgenomates group bacterium]
MKTIQPRTLKGFRDFLPEDMKIRQRVIALFRQVFESFGYEPLETPTLEHADILLGKYGEEAEQLIYQFEDRGGRKVAMKYDLTVPTCRVVAQYGDKIPLPFKRYQIQPVWRADNTQKGRFREFFQCDADTIGSSSMIADAEFIQMGLAIMGQLGFTDYYARINNRKFIDGLVQYAGATQDQFYVICIAIDKLEKIGLDGVIAEMEKKGVAQDVIKKIIEVVSLKGTNEELIAKLSIMMKDVPIALEGLNELKEIFSYLTAAQVEQELYTFDLSIIRGLSYYTGPVWEFTVRDGGVGSVAGCGRYDKLVGLYLGRDVPATGGSFGIERLFEVIKERGLLKDESNKQELVTIFSPELAKQSFELANTLRKKGKSVILYPDETAKLEKQLKYANKKGIETVYILGPEEIEKKTVKVKNMKTGEQTVVNF